jgi:hypothetical protein
MHELATVVTALVAHAAHILALINPTEVTPPGW